MDLRKLKTILELFEQAKIQELEISEGEDRLRLVKDRESTKAFPLQIGQASMPQQNPATLPQLPVPAPDTGPGVEEDDNVVKVTALMVGTYYSSPSENDPQFVKVGDKVTEGDTVCIIEAMKLFNNVSAPVSGTIKTIEVQNEQPVGYGDVLMTIETA